MGRRAGGPTSAASRHGMCHVPALSAGGSSFEVRSESKRANCPRSSSTVRPHEVHRGAIIGG